MKKIEALYQEILQNEALKGEFVEAVKGNQVEAFLQKNNCNATPAELQEVAERKQSAMGLLSDAELDAAAGGNDVHLSADASWIDWNNDEELLCVYIQRYNEILKEKSDYIPFS